MTRHAWPFVLPAGALLAMLIGSTAGAAEMTVNSLEDTITGDGACTLREAINNANGNRDTTGGDCPSGSPATPDTIRFAVSGTIMLGSPLPAISDPAGLTIDGTGQSLTVSGNSEPHSVVSVMVVEAEATLNLTGLTVANGWGGIENKGILTIVNSTISNNSSYGIGGISNQGTLTLTHSTLSGNRAELSSGGGISNCNGTLTITDSTFANNRSVQREGGAIFNCSNGTVTIKNSTFIENVAGGDHGGGILNSGTLTITNSTFSKNGTIVGGGIYTSGTAIVTNSTFSGNRAGGSGGGIYNWGTLTVTSSTFARNGGQEGGGILNSGTLIVTSSIFTGNSAREGGGIHNRDTTLIVANLTAANSTFAGNNVSRFGSGIYNNGNSLTVVNSTFAGNYAGEGPYDSASGAGIYNATGSFTLANTILANNTGGDCLTQSSLLPAGVNLVQDGSCGASADPVHFLTGDPMLNALTDNGGSTQTLALQPGSPAIDKADNAICADVPVNNLDQRGITRPQGDRCDIGAFELIQNTPFSIGPVIEFFDQAVANGSLLGIGPGRSARHRLTALRHQLLTAGAYIDQNAIPPACTKLTAALQRIHTDGPIKCSQFVTGPAASGLVWRLQSMQQDLGCRQQCRSDGRACAYSTPCRQGIPVKPST